MSASLNPFIEMKQHVVQHMPDLADIYAARYDRNKSMSEIGELANKSLQTVRNKLISIWSLLESNAPQLIKEVKENLDSDNPDTRNIGRDMQSYTGRHVLIKSSGEQEKPMHFNVGKRNNLNLLSDVKHALIENKDKPPVDQIHAALKAAGLKGTIAIARFGIRRSKSMTLDDLGSKYNLTRERIRQIASFMAKILYVAEVEADTGSLRTLLKSIHATFPAGSGTIDRVSSVMESAGISGISEEGMVYLLHGIGIENVTMRALPYIHDPEMKADDVAKEIKARERYFRMKEQAAKRTNNPTTQILVICKPELIEGLDKAIVQKTTVKTSRGQFITNRLTEQTLREVAVSDVEWKNEEWISRSVKISTELFDLIAKVAVERNVTKTALLNGGIEAISKPS